MVFHVLRKRSAFYLNSLVSRSLARWSHASSGHEVNLIRIGSKKIRPKNGCRSGGGVGKKKSARMREGPCIDKQRQQK